MMKGSAPSENGSEGLRHDIVQSIIQIHHFFRSELKEIDENNTQIHTSIFYIWICKNPYSLQLL